MKSRILLLTIACFALAVNVFSQQKEITKEQYYQSFRGAKDKASKVSRRSIDKREYFRNSKLHLTQETVDEFLSPDKRRYFVIEKFDDRITKDELIKIGDIYYCRKNDGDWKQSQNWCSGGSASGISNIVSSKYTVEEIKLNNETVKFYRQLTTYKNTYSPDKDREGLSYWESKFWLNSDGLIQREERKQGLLDSEKIYNQTVTTYEYNPKNLKIEAPITKSESKAPAKP
jgi:hypothetical protein